MEDVPVSCQRAGNLNCIISGGLVVQFSDGTAVTNEVNPRMTVICARGILIDNPSAFDTIYGIRTVLYAPLPVILLYIAGDQESSRFIFVLGRRHFNWEAFGKMSSLE